MNIPGITQHMSLRELKEIIGSTNGIPKPTPLRLKQSSIPVDSYTSDDYCITVYLNGFAVAESGKRYTVVRVDECGNYTYEVDNLVLKHKSNDATPHDFAEDYFLDLPWPIRVTMESIDQFETNENNREKRWLSKHPEIPDDRNWMTGRYSSFEEAALRRMEMEDIVESMTEMQRKTYFLYFVYGYNQREIGEMLCISRNSVRNRLIQAMKKLRQYQE